MLSFTVKKGKERKGHCKVMSTNQVKCWSLEERLQPEYPKENLSVQSREPTNSTHM